MGVGPAADEGWTLGVLSPFLPGTGVLVDEVVGTPTGQGRVTVVGSRTTQTDLLPQTQLLVLVKGEGARDLYSQVLQMVDLG